MDIDWELLLFAIELWQPWCFAFDNVNYACWLPAFFSEMPHIKETHPEAYEYIWVSTRRVATQKIQGDLLNVNTFGKKAYGEFRAQHLEANSLNVGFHDFEEIRVEDILWTFELKGKSRAKEYNKDYSKSWNL